LLALAFFATKKEHPVIQIKRVIVIGFIAAKEKYLKTYTRGF
jgi:hypothetical protein